MEIMDLIVKAVGIAANKLRIEAPKVVKQDTNCEYVFDSLKYTIELSESFIKDNDELTVVGMAIHELRHEKIIQHSRLLKKKSSSYYEL